MKDSLKRYAWLVVSCILLLILVIQIRSLEPLDHQITYIWQNKDKIPDTDRAYELLDEAQDYDMLWWTTEGKNFISCEELSTEVQCPVIAMTGDAGSCTLGYQTASRLFGDTNVIGLKVAFQGQEFTIRSVSEDIKDLFAYARPRKDKGSFDRLTLYFDDPGMKGFVRSRAETIYEPDEMLDQDLVCFMVEIGAAIILILAGLLANRAIKLKSAGKPTRIVLTCITWTVVASFIIWLVKVPVDFIPGKWSDFDFWKELIWAKKNAIYTFISAELSAMDMNWVRKYFAIVVTEVLCAFSLIIAGVDFRKD